MVGAEPILRVIRVVWLHVCQSLDVDEPQQRRIVDTGATGASEAPQRVMGEVASFEDGGRGEIDVERGSCGVEDRAESN